MDDLLWLSLSLVRGIGIKKLRAMHNLSFTAKDLSSPAAAKILGGKLYERLILQHDIGQLMEEAERYREEYRKKGIEIIPYTNPQYPGLLKQIPDPPVLLYCKGNTGALKSEWTVAVVGTRRPTGEGLMLSEKAAREFSARGFVIVSGLAAGIDTAAHCGAIQARGITIAVLPGSFDHIYPKENRGLADRIIQNNGLLLTEYPLGTEMQKRHFVARDRVQSGLSMGVCVVQTEVDGGAMHTANFCRLHERLLFCTKPHEGPGLAQYSGVLKLLEEGAVLLKDTSAGFDEAVRLLKGAYT